MIRSNVQRKKEELAEPDVFDNILSRLTQLTNEEDMVKSCLDEYLLKSMTNLGSSRDNSKIILFFKNSTACTKAMFQKRSIVNKLRQIGVEKDIDFKVGGF